MTKRKHIMGYEYNGRKFRWYPETDEIGLYDVARRRYDDLHKSAIEGEIVPVRGTDLFCLGLISSIIAEIVPIKLKYYGVAGFKIVSKRCLVRDEYTGTFDLNFITFTDDASYAQFVLLYKDQIDWNNTRIDLLEEHD